MNVLNRKATILSLAVGVLGAAGFIEACSGSSNGGSGTTNNGSDGSTSTTPPNSDDGGGSSVSTTAGSCANPTLQLIFSPMYSAYIPGSTSQTFEIPAVTADGNPATWSLSDPSQANMAPQSFPVGGVNQPGVMITVAGTGSPANGAVESTGTVTVIATESGGACGQATLTITQNAESDWTIGEQRYNNGNVLSLPEAGAFQRPDGGFNFEGGIPEGGFPHPDAAGFGGGGGNPLEPTDGAPPPACTTCHGPTATNFLYKDVQHTPEQTGGFSDTDLANIIQNAQVPDGGYFDPSVLITSCDAGTTLGPDVPECFNTAYARWQQFHTWTDITAEELPGVICYLRSLPPEAQTGSSNFGGGGGGHHHDGGAGGGAPPPSSDAGLGGD